MCGTDRAPRSSRQRVVMAHRARGGLLRLRPQLLRVAAAVVLVWCVAALPQMQGVGAARIQDLAAYKDCTPATCKAMYVICGCASRAGAPAVRARVPVS